MNGHEGFLQVFLSYSMAFGVVSLVAAGIGLAPLTSVPGAWRRGLLGFVAGSVFAALWLAFVLEGGLMGLIGSRALAIAASALLFLVILLSPPVGGMLALKALLARSGGKIAES